MEHPTTPNPTDSTSSNETPSLKTTSPEFLDRLKSWEGFTGKVINSPEIHYDHKIMLLILTLMVAGNVGICVSHGTFFINLLLTCVLGIFAAFFIKSRENQNTDP